MAAWALTVPAPSLAQITPTTSEPVPPVAARGADATSAIDESSWRAAFGQANFSEAISVRTVIGEIEDLIGRERSAVTAAGIAVGGFLGLGEKRLAIPINQINIAGEARFTINMSTEEIKNAAAFDFAKRN